ncbi:MAG: hypothetical protein NTY35_04455 [Planctomycetota bacterium]|nr:hypothetical protein [Planctomycetota bacterium]
MDTADWGAFGWMDCPPEQVEIEIRPGEPIEGRVECLDGTLPALGTRAVAIPEHLERFEPPDLDGLLSSPEVLVAAVGQDGTFHLDGALRSTAYSVYATARGYVTTDYSRNVRAADSTVVVRLGRLYGRRILLSDGGLGAPRASPGLFDSDAPAWRLADAEVIRVDRMSSLLSVLGELPANSAAPGGQYDRLFLYTSRVWANAIGPLEYFGKLPGYEPFDVRVPLPAIELLGDVPVLDLPLRAQAAGWGSLRVRFQDAPVDRWAASDACGPLGVVRLISGPDAYCEFAVRSLPEEGLVQEGIPFGEYEVVFSAVTNLHRSPPRSAPPSFVRIGSREATTTIALHEMGAVSLELEFAEGLTPPDSVYVSIYAEGNDSPYFGHACAENSYVLAGLAPWTYRFEVTSPIRTQRSDPVIVVPGPPGRARLQAR